MVYLFSLLTIFIFSFMAWGQNFNHQLKGSYKLQSSVSGPVKYTLRWSESAGVITGEYSDNYFTPNAQVTGTEGENGRTFLISFPVAQKGVKSINLITSDADTKRTGITLPVSIITRDVRGNPLTTAEATTRFTATTMVAQNQEEECQENFGALQGFCGIYSGLITEMVDRQNRCNLLMADAINLELRPDAMLRLYLGEVDPNLETPYHEIGRLPANPEGRTIDVMGRVCNSLYGIDSKSDDCKRLNLSGEFSSLGEVTRFRGTYTIYDEGTKNTCRYRLSLDR
jgi:hypothetical protein